MMSTLRLVFVIAGCALLLVALPARAQDAGGPAGAPDDAPQAAQGAQEEDAGGPEDDSEGPAAEAAAAGEAVEDAAAGDTAAGESPDEGAENPAEGAVVVEVEEGGVLDDQTFEGEDDDFIPSEEIPIDQPIPFPTDI